MTRPVHVVASAALWSRGGEVAPIAPADDPVPFKARKTMSRGAYLAAVALRRVLDAAGWRDRDGVGYFLGVGASGGSMEDLEAILRASIEDGALRLDRFGAAGIAACNPMLAFQLMNNFTLAHGAILEGLTGPASAYFSRGAGTMHALSEAVHAIASGECDRAIAGGADSGLHPVTAAEVRRDSGMHFVIPREGAALLALAAGDGHGVLVEAARVDSARDAVAAIDGPVDLVVASVQSADRAFFAGELRDWWPAAEVIESLAVHGECLAATAALDWAIAVEHVRAHGGRAVVISNGFDASIGLAIFRRDGGASAVVDGHGGGR